MERMSPRAAPRGPAPARARKGAAGFALALAAAGAAAQGLPPAVPDAARLERQQRESERAQEERERLINPPERAVPRPPAPPPAAPAAPGPTFVLRSVEFDASVYFTRAELDAFAAPVIGQRVDFAAVQRIVDAINGAYRAKGQYAARALLPPQTVRDGAIRIALVEAKAGQTVIQGAQRVDEGMLRRWLAPQTGQVIDIPGTDERVARFMRSTDTQVALELKEGRSQGESDIVMTVREPSPLGLKASLSNEGNPLTGRVQAGAEARWFSPLRRGDRLAGTLVKSEGAESLAAGYTLPLNAWGGVAGITASRGKSKIIDGPFAALDVRGRSSGQSLNLRQPLGGFGRLQFELSAALNRYKSENSIAGVELGAVRSRTEQGGFAASWRDQDSDLNGSMQWISGRAEAANGLQLPGHAKTVDLSFVERFPSKSSALVLQYRRQESGSGALPSIMQLSLGGPGTVRGYNVGALVADSGYSMSADYHFRVKDGLSAYVFADSGTAWLTGGPRQRISSTGVGGEWQAAEKVAVNAYVAHATNAAVATQGRNRLWAKVTYQFY